MFDIAILINNYSKMLLVLTVSTVVLLGECVTCW